MNEPTNIRINLYVTSTIWRILQKKENYSDYIRNLIEIDLSKRNKKLNI